MNLIIENAQEVSSYVTQEINESQEAVFLRDGKAMDRFG